MWTFIVKYSSLFVTPVVLFFVLIGCEQSYEPDMSDPEISSKSIFNEDTLIRYTWYPDNYIFGDYEHFMFKGDGTFTIFIPNQKKQTGTWKYKSPQLTLEFYNPPEDYIDRIVLTVNSFSSKLGTLYTNANVYTINNGKWSEYQIAFKKGM